MFFMFGIQFRFLSCFVFVYFFGIQEFLFDGDTRSPNIVWLLDFSWVAGTVQLASSVWFSRFLREVLSVVINRVFL